MLRFARLSSVAACLAATPSLTHATSVEPVLPQSRVAPAVEVPTFEAMDADRNGFLSRDELADWIGPDDPGADVFAFFDADGDGFVDRDEFERLEFEPVRP